MKTPLTVEEVANRSPESEQSETWIERFYEYLNHNQEETKNGNSEQGTRIGNATERGGRLEKP